MWRLIRSAAVTRLHGLRHREQRWAVGISWQTGASAAVLQTRPANWPVGKN